MQQEVLAIVKASSPRRWIGVAMLITVGAMVIYVALAAPPEPAWQVFLLIVGAGSFWLAHRMWHATSDRIELTETELRTASGRVLAAVQDIERVERGVFAFKPSNGFLVTTYQAGQKSWAPGLWWCVGRRIGIGGMTAASETKFMSEVLSAMIAERS